MQSALSRVFAIIALLLIAGSMSACSKCGFFWEDGRTNSCRSDTAPR